MSTFPRSLPIVFLLAAACAHQQQTAAAPPPAPPRPVAEPLSPELAPVPVAAADHGAELDLLLSRPISYFGFDEALLTSEDRQRLPTLAGALQARPDVRIRIAGNCDERGTEEYNLLLGQRRAEVAKRYLTDLGVAPDRIGTISYGKERPVDPAHSEEAWAANRRDDAEALSTVSRR